MNFVAFDPGRSTGISTFADNTQPLLLHIARGLDELIAWCEKNGPYSHVIYEDYRLFQHKALQQSGSHIEAAQAIGIIKVYIKKWESAVSAQQPQCHKIGMMYPGGIKYGAHDKSHDLVAHNHGIYYFVKNGLRPTTGGFTIVQKP